MFVGQLCLSRWVLIVAVAVGLCLLAVGCSEPQADTPQIPQERGADAPTPEEVLDSFIPWCSTTMAEGLNGDLLEVMPGGKEVVIEWDGGLYRVSLDGLQTKLIQDLAPGSNRWDERHWADRFGGTNLSADASEASSRLAFSTCRYSQSVPWSEKEYFQSEVVTTDLDGTALRRLTDNLAEDYYPVWSPDGARLAYFTESSLHKISLATVSVAGGDSQKLVTFGFKELAPRPPSWSPAGNLIAFLLIGETIPYCRSSECELSHWTWHRRILHTVGADGSGFKAIFEVSSEPAWSPDGERIAFAKRHGGRISLFTADPDGSDMEFVTPIFLESDLPWVETVAWSPDGSRILYSCGGMCVTDLEGLNPVRLPSLRPPAHELFWNSRTFSWLHGTQRRGAWTPDGKRIVVRMTEGINSTELYSVGADGTDLRHLATATHEDLVKWDSEFPELKPARAETTGSPKHDCSSNPDVEANGGPGLRADCETLLRLRPNLTGNSPFHLNWDSSVPLRSWDGVTIEGTPPRVARLELGWKRFLGAIPPSLSQLTALRSLDLQFNAIGGTIPVALGSLPNLEELVLHGNYLTGTVPTELGNLDRLRTLSLDFNFLTGCIPSDLNRPETTIVTLELNFRDVSLRGPKEFC